MQIGKIPSKYIEPIKLLINISDDSINQLCDSFSEIDTWTKSDDLASLLHPKIKSEDINESSLSDIIDLLLSLLRTADENDISLDQLINSVSESVIELDVFSELEKKESLQPKLFKLIESSGSLKFIAKSYGLTTEYEHVFLRSRVLTDIRPVFDDDLSNGLVSAAIVHTLKIDYVEGGDQKSFYIALDNDDVQQLQIQINRATEKNNEIQKVLGSWRNQLIEDEISPN
jgi:hypothetical protein